jgi:ABC-type molybdate transport system permease subunit
MFVTVALIVCLLAVAIPLVVRALRRANRTANAAIRDICRPAPVPIATPAPKENRTA